MSVISMLPTETNGKHTECSKEGKLHQYCIREMKVCINKNGNTNTHKQRKGRMGIKRDWDENLL